MDVALPLLAEAECGDYAYAPLDAETLRRACGLGSLASYDDQLAQLHFVAISEVVDAMGTPPIPSPRTDHYRHLQAVCRLSMRADPDVPPVVQVAGVPVAQDRVTMPTRHSVEVSGDLPAGRASIAYTTAPRDGAQYAAREAVRQLVAWYFRTGAGETGRGGRPLPKPAVRPMVRPYGLPTMAELIR